MGEFSARVGARGVKGGNMIRGCQREMIVLQTKESALFESAYFVLRRGCRASVCGDMLAESNRIVGEGREYFQKRQKRRKILPFLCGFLAGGVIAALITALILL
jgi:hypothetical protein